MRAGSGFALLAVRLMLTLLSLPDYDDMQVIQFLELRSGTHRPSQNVPARREPSASLSSFLDPVHFVAGHAIAR